MSRANRAAGAGQPTKRSTRSAPAVMSADGPLAAQRPSPRSDADVDAGRPGQHVLRAQEPWLDLIADLIVQDLRDKESRDADALRGVRQVQ